MRPRESRGQPSGAGTHRAEIPRVPDDPSLALRGAAAALDAGDIGGAETRLRAALAATPHEPRVTGALADTLAGDGRLDEAEALLRDALQATGNPITGLQLARVLVGATGGDRDERLADAARLVDDARDVALRDPSTTALLRVTEGRLLLASGHPARALRALSHSGPDVLPDPAIHLVRARAHRELGAFSRASEEVTRAIELSARTPALLVLRARDTLAAGDPANAIVDARAAADAEPDRAAARIVLAQALLARGSAQDALTELNRLPADARDTPEVATLRARALAAQGNSEAAAGELARAAAAASTPDQALRIGMLLAQARDRDDGDATNERAFLADFVRTNPQHAGGATHYANLLRLHGALAEARATLATALVTHPNDTALLLARFETALASAEGAPAEPAIARQTSDALTTAAAGSWQDLLARGRLALGDGDSEGALDLLRLAAEAAPSRAKSHAFMALAAQRAGHTREARTAAERALEVGGDLEMPRRVLAGIVLGEAQRAFEAGSSAEALAALSEAIGLDTSSARGGLAVAAWRAGRSGDRQLLLQARTECERLLAQTPDGDGDERARIWFALGNVARDLGDAGGYRTATEQHLRLAPDDPLAHARRAGALAAAGLVNEALSGIVAAHDRLGDAPALVVVHVRLLGASGQEGEAEAVARSWAASHAASAPARVLIGQTLMQQRKWAPAEAAFRDALQIDAAQGALSTGAVRGLASALVAREARDEAIALLADSLPRIDSADRPGLALFHANLLLQADPQSAEALTTLTALAADDTAPVPVRCASTSQTIDLLLRAGQRSRAAEIADASFAWVMRDRACSPEGQLATRAANVLTAAGIATEQAGARSASRKFYREALERDPSNVIALNNLAEQLAASPSTADQAVLLARRATTSSPGTPEYRDSLGNALLADKQPERAIDAYEEAIRLYGARGGAAGATLTGLADVENVRITQLSLSRARTALER